ncbi:MAG: UvrY/SirA/GacA family response regulator transcription factor [Methylophaga sp.]
METVMIADDHSAVRIGIRQIIEKLPNIKVVGEAENGESAYEMYSKLTPSLIIIDISMPGIGGLESIRRMFLRKHDPKVIVYTMHDEAIHVRKALEAGAVAYVLKSEPVDDLIMAIEKVSTAQRYLSNVVAQKLAIENVSGDLAPIERLTAREYEVFCFLVKGLKVSEIAKLLAISTKTVATYQTQLKQKLHINNAVDLVKVAMKAGILEQ